MTPDFDTRLKSIASAMDNIILPAISPADSLALQQADLIIKHISMMRKQLPHIVAFERLCLHDIEQTARRLLDLPSIDGVPAERDALANTLDECGLQASARFDALGLAIEDLIGGAQAAGLPELLTELADLILDFGARHLMRERVWFADTGFEGQEASLPSIAELAATG